MLQDILLFTPSANSAYHTIFRLGGRVTNMFTEELITARLPEAVDISSLDSVSLPNPNEFKIPESHVFYQAWNAMQVSSKPEADLDEEAALQWVARLDGGVRDGSLPAKPNIETQSSLLKEGKASELKPRGKSRSHIPQATESIHTGQNVDIAQAAIHFPTDFHKVDDSRSVAQNRVMKGPHGLVLIIVSRGGLSPTKQANIVSAILGGATFLANEDHSVNLINTWRKENYDVNVRYPGYKKKIQNPQSPHAWYPANAITALPPSTLYVVQDDDLYAVDIVNGSYKIIANGCRGTTQSAALSGKVYYLQGGQYLMEYDPVTDLKPHPIGTKNWGQVWAGAMAAISDGLVNRLYITANDGLWAFNPASGQLDQWSTKDYSAVREMTALGDKLYFVNIDDKLWCLDTEKPWLGEILVGGKIWDHSKTWSITSLGGWLYILYDGALWRVNPGDGSSLSLAPEWPLQVVMTALNDKLYIVQNTELWEVDAYNGPHQNGNELLEAPWRDDVLQKMGYAKGREGISELANAIGQGSLTPGMFMKVPTIVFVTDYPLPYGVGGYAAHHFIVLSSSSPTLELDFIHEVCHAFGAADEYNNPRIGMKCICDPAGRNRVPNKNCKNCTSQQVPCVMHTRVHKLCNWTRGQIGWSYWERVGAWNWLGAKVMMSDNCGANQPVALYISQDRDMWRVNPSDGTRTQVGQQHDWSNTTAMVQMPMSEYRAYIVQGDKLWSIDLNTWDRQPVGNDNWRDSRAIVALFVNYSNDLCVLQGSDLWWVNLKNGTRDRIGNRNWSKASTMANYARHSVVIQEGAALWIVEVSTGKETRSGTLNWASTTAIARVSGSSYYVQQDSKLWQADIGQSWTRQRVGSDTDDWSGTKAMVACSEDLYILCRGELWRVREL